MISKRKNTQWAAVLWEKRSSWSQWSEERGQVASRWQEDNINSKNHWLQLRYAEEHLLMHNMPNLEADGYSNRRQNMVQEQETKAAIKTKIGQKIEKKTLPHRTNWESFKHHSRHPAFSSSDGSISPNSHLLRLFSETWQWVYWMQMTSTLTTSPDQ